MSGSPITLYFGLKKGENADLEVVAAAAIEWVAGMRAAAQEIDPSASISVGIVDAEEGSLKLHATLDWAEKQASRIIRGESKYPTLRSLLIAFAIFVPTTGIPTLDYYFGDDPVLRLEDEDRKLFENLLEKLQENEELGHHRRQFFKKLERDPSITEVGVAEGRDKPVRATVPANQFAERSGLWVLEEQEDERTTRTEIDVTLIGPILVSSQRSWKFYADGFGEFSAIMTDQRFLNALEHDDIKEHLRTGIRMRVVVKLEEEKVAGAWKPKRRGRTVERVIEPRID